MPYSYRHDPKCFGVAEKVCIKMGLYRVFQRILHASIGGSWEGGTLGAKDGTLAGAAIGTAILPGLGTAVGGIAGGLILGVAGSSLRKWVIDITDVGE